MERVLRADEPFPLPTASFYQKGQQVQPSHQMTCMNIGPIEACQEEGNIDQT